MNVDLSLCFGEDLIMIVLGTAIATVEGAVL